MLSFQLAESLSVFGLGLEQIFVPLLVKLMILLNVGVLTLLSSLSLVEDELVELSLVVLELELGNPVFGHFSLNVLALDFAGVAVLLKDLAIGRKAVKKKETETYIKSSMLSSLGS